MVATRLIPLHVNKRKTIAQSLGDRTDYAKNPEKTEKGELVIGYQSDPMTVDEEFMLSKRQYEQITGRRQKDEVIAYQIRQSFKPGEITPEEANRVGHELALRFTKGKYAFIVATHTDRAHVHNHISNRTPQIALFDFKAFLNISMLLVESENAKVLRQIMLDIVIDFVNQRTGGSTKYINQRDRDFISAFLQEENYRREFTDALRDYVSMGNSKYAIYTDKIYQSIFREKAQEYKQVLHLSKRDSVRDTMYSEVLDLIASYECGLAAMIKDQSTQLGRKLNNWELSDLFSAFESLPLWKPQILRARTKMASRDMALRDAFHMQLEEYIKPLEAEEYEKFLGVAGDELELLMHENQDVLKRLKERN